MTPERLEEIRRADADLESRDMRTWPAAATYAADHRTELLDEVDRLAKELRAARGLWYGACAARTEHAHALAQTYQKIAKLEAERER